MPAKVRIRIDDFEDGLLPGVCASSGVPGAHLHRISVSSRTPGWLWLAVLAGPVGILAALVLSGVLRKTAHGYVPYADEVHVELQRKVHRFAWGVAQGFGAVVAALVLAVGGPESFRPLAVIVAIVGMLAMCVYAFLWTNPPGSVGGHLDSTGRWVELDPVSGLFAEAYEAQEADRRRARRDEVTGTRLDR